MWACINHLSQVLLSKQQNVRLTIGFYHSFPQSLKKPFESLNVVEIGCGSGAISLALAKALPGLGIVAADQSRMACQLTEENAENLNLVR